MKPAYTFHLGTVYPTSIHGGKVSIDGHHPYVSLQGPKRIFQELMEGFSRRFSEPSIFLAHLNNHLGLSDNFSDFGGNSLCMMCVLYYHFP